MRLKPYTGPHAGHLYHVVDDEGRVIRNASVLEVKLWESHQDLLAALNKYEEAFEEMFAQCASNGVFDAWQKPVNCTALNEAHRLTGNALNKAKVN